MRRISLTLGFMLSSAVPLAAQAQAIDTSGDPRLLPWQAYIDEAALRFKLPKDWIGRVLLAESGGKPLRDGRPIRSAVGAMGLMQLMPNTYADMRMAHNLGADPDDPHDNIMAASAYLRALFDRYDYPGLFAAYNAGPTRYEASLRGVPLPPETRAYVAKLTVSAPMAPPRPGLFIALSTTERQGNTGSASAIFVPLAPAIATSDGPGQPTMAQQSDLEGGDESVVGRR